MAERPATIYALKDPDSGAVRYIGCTRQRLSDRLDHHASRSRRRDPKTLWVNSLLAAEKRPVIEALEVVGDGDEDLVERFWIAQARALGWPILNLCIGGGGAPGLRFTPEHRAKISAANRGKKLSTEHIARMRRIFTGRKRPEPEREKIRQGLRRRFEDPAERIKLSRAHGGTPVLEVTTGQRFETMVDAAKAFGLHPSSVGQVINGKRNSIYGYKFQRVPDAGGTT